MQDQNADCGAACLAMILAHFGCHVPLHELADALDAGRDGSNAASLLKLARRYGLTCKGFKSDTIQLLSLSPPVIAHVERVHFVVLAHVSPDRVTVLDPSRGVRSITTEELDRWYSGVALVFEPSPEFLLRKRVRVPSERYRHVMLGVKAHLAAVLGVSFFLRAIVLLVPAITVYVIDHILPSRNWKEWRLMCMAAAGFFFTYSATESLRAWLLSHVKHYFDERTIASLIDHILKIPFKTFNRMSPSGIISRFSNNTSVRDALSQVALSFLLDSLFVFAYSVVMFRTSPTLASACICVGFLHGSLMLLSRGKTRELSDAEVDAQSAANSFALETIRGVEVLKVFGAEASAGVRWKELSRRQIDAAQLRAIWAGRVDAIGSGLNIAGSLVIFLLGSSLVMSQELSVGQLFGFAALAGAFFGPLAGLSSGFRGLVLSETHLARVEDLFRYAPEVTVPDGAAHQVLVGRLELQDVFFRYSHSASWTLNGISMTIEPGEFVAIVGRSGCGKSTLARLIASLYFPTSGTLAVDGSEVTTIDLLRYRQHLGTALQGAHIFNDSIATNILLDRPQVGNEDLLNLAAELAVIREDIDAMPMGFDTPLSESGRNVSGGQRQRICIARAIAREPTILILDEATSEVDSITEKQIYANLKSLACTKIVVAHRMELVRMADRIIVVDCGKVAEQGNHEELRRLGGIYCRLLEGRGSTAHMPSDVPT